MKRIIQGLFLGVCVFYISIATAMDFHILVDSQQQGPISMKQLQKMVSDGTVTKDTMVWKNGMPDWVKAGGQAELQSLFITSTLPPTPSTSVPPPPPAHTTVVPTPTLSENSSNDQSIDAEVITSIQEKSDEGSTNIVREAIEEWRVKKGIEFGGEDERGRMYYMAVAPVAVDATNSQWPKWRVIAYDQAYAKIKKEFAKQIYGRQIGEDFEELFQDDSDNRFDFNQSDDTRAYTKSGEIWDKVKALTGAKLDQALEKYGIDPTKYNAAPPEQRKRLFANNFAKTTLTKAGGYLNGLITIKTFEGIDEKGNYSIGVVAMYYDKLKQLADDIAKRRVPMLKIKSGKPIQTYIAKDNKKLTESFGVRLVFDEGGNPVIVSYGQWSYMYKGQNERKRSRGYDFALGKATMEAERNIIKFLNSKATYEKLDTINANEVENVILDRDGNIVEQDIMTMIDKMTSTMRIQFKGDLRGQKTFKKYSYKHENGHEIVGVVKIWTQKTALAADKVRNWKSNYKNPNEEIVKRGRVPVEKTGVREGAGMDLDF